MYKLRSAALLLVFAVLITTLAGCVTQDGGTATTEPAGTTQPGGAEAPTTAVDLPNLSAKEVADAIMAAFDGQELSPMSRYYFGASEDAPEYFEPERSGWLITGKMAADPVMDLLSDYAFYVPKGWYAFEVDVLKVKDTINLAEAGEYLQARRNRQDSPDLEFYNSVDVPVIRNARIFTIGNYAIMLATTDNDKAQGAIDKLFEGKAQVNTAIPTSPAETTTEPDFDFSTGLDEVSQIQSVTNFDFSMLDPEPKKNLPLDQITKIPTITVRKYSRDTMFLLGGSCEEGAVIHVRGGAEEINSRSDYGDWLVEVPIDPKNLSVLYMTATAPGKAESDPVKFIVRPQTGITMYEDSGIYAVVVGNDYFSWFDDCIPGFVGSDLMDDKGIESLKKRYAKKITDMRGKGLNTEIIVLMIPSPMRLYADKVPSYLKQNKGTTLTDQFNKAMGEIGVTVVDLSEVMFAHKDDPFKIFHRTDSHWSDYGAYFGYVELMNHIAKKFPDAAPRPSSDFEFYNKKVDFGDIYNTLGLGRSVLKEYSVFVNFKFDPPGGFRNLYNGESVVIDHNVTNKRQTTESNLTDLKLPSAFVMRDSFCGPIFNYMTDRFSKISWQAMWDYSFDLNRIVETKPDYLIYVINERNIKNIMYE